MTRPLWTIDALNREHPLLDGWRWELWDNGISPVAMHRDGTFCAVMEGGPFGEGLAAVADDGSFCSAPLDVVRVERADLADGLLIIDLVREIPDAMKPRKIAIGGSATLTAVPSGDSEDAASAA